MGLTDLEDKRERDRQEKKGIRTETERERVRMKEGVEGETKQSVENSGF